ncbi:unnamed protein product [Clavelina lepadiformis]|uniref:SH3 domain-containing protein n=1 Tax=Clavelina lepadiformis TaxID=159417 RepID=A0ABP0H1D8_CLALP
MSAGSDEVVIALYDYTAKDPEELSIRKNEQLTLLDSKFTWWKGNEVNLIKVKSALCGFKNKLALYGRNLARRNSSSFPACNNLLSVTKVFLMLMLRHTASIFRNCMKTWKFGFRMYYNWRLLTG